MSLDGPTVLAILGMAAATYLCRGGGYWLMSRLRPPPLARAALAYVPGTLFVSYLAPALLQGGPPQWAGAAVSAAVMATTRDTFLAILAGTATAWAMWSL